MATSDPLLAQLPMARTVAVVLSDNALHDQAVARFERGASRPAREPMRGVVSHL